MTASFYHSPLLSGDSQHDGREGRLSSVSGRHQLHANRQLGAQEVGLPLSHELRKVAAGHGHHGRQHIREGETKFVIIVAVDIDTSRFSGL